jgi:hypothetical protein
VSDFDIADLRRRGFVGFVPVAALTRESLQVPVEPGVYVVVRPTTDPPLFLASSGASWFKGKDPNVSIGQLASEWVDGAQTLYIGRTAAQLRVRVGLLTEFSRAGRFRSVFHFGGRLLWQLDGSQELLVAWKVEPDCEDLEADLIDEFVDAYGRLPFANLKRGSRKAK